jgi:bifunctional DNA-binding transcriptional regulator/antitoxin component of YhaV-PrlF toxin-antitoxin module
MSVTRRLILNKNGQYTITLPKNFMENMDAEAGDKFKFKYNGKDTLLLRRMGC